MKNRPHVIDNKKLDVKRSTPRKDAVKMESSANVNKLFVGGLDESVLEEDLREYFGQFGNITEVVLKAPKEGVRVRAFAFITYDDYDPVDKVISMPFPQTFFFFSFSPPISNSNSTNIPLLLVHLTFINNHYYITISIFYVFFVIISSFLFVFVDYFGHVETFKS